MARKTLEPSGPAQVALNILKFFFMASVVCTFVVSIIGTAVFIHFSSDLPNIITVEDYKPALVTKVIGKDGVLVGEFFEERRYLTPLENIPDTVIHAFVSAEDDRFFEHPGVDLQGILRAAFANFKAGRVVQGGSTITQQVAKSLLLTPEKSIFRKIKEAILAYRMEKNLTKKQILYLYLNQIYLGQGAYGVQAASQVYFNKDVHAISIAEAAILAGLPQAPSKYSPLSNPKKAKERQAYVLRRMVEDRVITAAEMIDASKQRIKIYLSKEINFKTAPYYVEYVRKHLYEKFGKDALYQGGLTVQTPVDANLSITATKALQDGLRNLDKKQGFRGPIKRGKDKIDEYALEALAFNIEKKFPYKLLLEDGSHAEDLAVQLGIQNITIDLFDENELYQAVVINVDDNSKETFVRIGPIKGKIPFDKLKWSYPVKQVSSEFVEPISKPSQSLAIGDLIWVKLISKHEKSDDKSGLPIFALEQIPVVQGALLSMNVKNGEVEAMVGGYDFKESEFNRAIQAERQPGSSFKPIIYAAAIDKGYTPATIIQDSPIVFDAGFNEKWKPENYEEKFYGDTTFRSSLVRSRNIPTIKIVQDIETPYLIEYSKRLGITKNLSPDLSIALGSSSSSQLDLVKAYAVFPRGGRKVSPIFIKKVTDRTGKVLEEAKPTPDVAVLELTPVPPTRIVRVAGELQSLKNAGKLDPNFGVWNPDPTDPERVMDTRTAYVMTHIMNEVATVGTGAEARNLGRTAAGKTGTTNDYLDAWFTGFTPQTVTSVWVGFDAQKSLGPKSTGGHVALPIWLDYMKESVKKYPEESFTVPKGVTFAYIDNRTGRVGKPNQPNVTREAFIEGTEPGGIVSSAREVSEDLSSGRQEGSTPATPSYDQSTEEFLKQDIE